MKYIKLLLVLCLFNISNVYALGSDTPTLVKMYATLKQQYETMKKSYESLKFSSETLNELRENSNYVYGEYKFISEFSIDGELSRMARDFDILNSLDNFGNLSAEQKYRFLKSQLDNRVMTEKESNLYSARLNQLQRLEELRIAKLKEAENANKMNDKTLKASAASSNAILSALALMEKEEKEKKKLEEQLKASQKLEYEKNFFTFLENESKKANSNTQ